MKLKVISDYLTDTGLCRRRNEDSVYCGEGDGIHVFCIADGMGGHVNGERASGEIVQAVKQWVQNFYPEKYNYHFLDILEDFDQCLQEVNHIIFQKYNQDTICGSTVAALLIYENKYAVFSLGDSRIYRKRKTRFEPITRDDTWQNSTWVPPEFCEREIRMDQRYDKLIHAVGTEENVIFRRQSDHLRKGDYFFLCSDGIYKICDEKVLKKICCNYTGLFPKQSLANRLEWIKEMVYKKGAPDNLSMILVRIDQL